MVNYLKAYNGLQLLGWTAALIFLFINVDTAYAIIAICQVASLLEILHAKNKWSSSSPTFSFLQIGARLMILYFVLKISVNVGDTTGMVLHTFNRVVLTMFFAWSIAEVVRYVYYLTELMGKPNAAVTWLRYTAFIVCYPTGLVCEIYVLVVLYAITTHHSVKLLVALIFIAYAIVFPMLYMHLLKQRKKKLS